MAKNMPMMVFIFRIFPLIIRGSWSAPLISVSPHNFLATRDNRTFDWSGLGGGHFNLQKTVIE